MNSLQKGNLESPILAGAWLHHGYTSPHLYCQSILATFHQILRSNIDIENGTASQFRNVSCYLGKNLLYFGRVTGCERNFKSACLLSNSCKTKRKYRKRRAKISADISDRPSGSRVTNLKYISTQKLNCICHGLKPTHFTVSLVPTW